MINDCRVAVLTLHTIVRSLSIPESQGTTANWKKPVEVNKDAH